MTALTSVILPVFLVIGFGYLAVWQKYLSDEAIDGLMKFAQGFAVPCLLYRGIVDLDLSANLNPGLLISFYGGALAGFFAGLFGARHFFHRSWEDAVAIGFCGLFSNSLLLGLPITERAYGDGALEANYAIIAFHAPFCYAVGITAMEIARAHGTAFSQIPAKIGKALFSNALIIGISLGFIANLAHIPQPAVLTDALNLITKAALPAALFGLGGVLYRYRPEGDMRTILFVCFLSLVLHPAVTWGLGWAFGLPINTFRSAIVTAAMAPGVNAYLFANLYGNAKRVAASSVLIGTAACLFTAAFWLIILP